MGSCSIFCKPQLTRTRVSAPHDPRHTADKSVRATRPMPHVVARRLRTARNDKLRDGWAAAQFLLAPAHADKSVRATRRGHTADKSVRATRPHDPRHTTHATRVYAKRRERYGENWPFSLESLVVAFPPQSPLRESFASANGAVAKLSRFAGV
jgi:hypothetical protein